MLMKQSSLKTIVFNNYSDSSCEDYFSNLPLTIFPEAICQFGNLTEKNKRSVDERKKVWKVIGWKGSDHVKKLEFGVLKARHKWG